MFLTLTALITILWSVTCTAAEKSNNWLVYWYICGSNLERDFHYATKDIAEMQHVKLPPNVKILINAGGLPPNNNGLKKWHHPTLKEGGDGIYLYSSNRLEKLVDKNANMGNPATLANFIKFGEENIRFGKDNSEADHKVFVFWNHGGLNGVCYDDNFKGDCLTYDEINSAFSSVYGTSPENPPFELIGFKACLTSSYELANSISPFSQYMVGAEPSIYDLPFKEWIDALAKDTSMTGAQIGKVFIDSAMKNYSSDMRLTHMFSVIDLSKMPELSAAYENYFDTAVKLADESEGFKGAFARAASSRNIDKYSDLYIDLGLLAKNTKSIMPKESDKLLKAVDNAVVYKKRGSYLKSKGISTYYPLISSGHNHIPEIEFQEFLSQNSSSQSQKNLYRKLRSLDISSLQGISVELNSDGHAVIELDEEQLENISMAMSFVVPVTENGNTDFGLEGEGAVVLTSVDDLKTDWNKGTVTETFRAVQPVFDGHAITMFATTQGRGHNFYDVPVLLDGSMITLQVRYDISDKKYSIIGINSNVENGMVRGQNLNLDNFEGKIITPLFLAVVPEDTPNASETEIQIQSVNRKTRKAEIHKAVREFSDPITGKKIYLAIKTGEPFVYTRDSKITDKKISNGMYAYFFQFISPNGKAVVSAPFGIEIQHGKVTRILD